MNTATASGTGSNVALFTTNDALGSVDVKAGKGFAKVFIWERRFDSVAACVLDGSVWFETDSNGIRALLKLAERLQQLPA